MKDQNLKPTHEEFQLGHGYGSGEKSSTAEQHASKKQFGDNPLAKNGGDFANANELQPTEEMEAAEPSHERPAKKK